MTAHAQDLEEGKWMGRLILPSGKVAEIFLHVNNKGGKTTASVEMGDDDRFPNVALQQDDLGLKLAWNPGLEINCQLYKQENGSYQGACTDEEGGKGPIIFAPPTLAGSPNLAQVFEDWSYYWKGRLP